MVAAAVIGGVAMVGSTVVSSNAAKKASNAATSAASTNNALQRDVYASNEGHLNPYIARGDQAGNAASRALGLIPSGPGDAPYGGFMASPGYQYRMDEGMRAISGNKAARGLLDSGSHTAGLINYGQQVASQEFGSWYDRLAAMANTGAGAASSLAGVGQNFASAVTANNNNAAGAIGNAALTNANNLNGLINTAAGAYGMYKGGVLGGLSSSYGGGR